MFIGQARSMGLVAGFAMAVAALAVLLLGLLSGGGFAVFGISRFVGLIAPGLLRPVYAAKFVYAATSGGDPLLVNVTVEWQQGRLAGEAAGANLHDQPHGVQPDNTAGEGDGTT